MIEQMNKKTKKPVATTSIQKLHEEARVQNNPSAQSFIPSSNYTESNEEKKNSSSSGKSESKKSVFATSYNFSNEVQKASKIANSDANMDNFAPFRNSFGMPRSPIQRNSAPLNFI